MQKIKIAGVRRITNDAQGNAINLTIIDLANGKPSIVRRPKEFLQDLKNSFVISEGVNSINHPEVRSAMKGLRGGYVEGEISYAKKGDKWTVTENSLAVKDPNHPQYGKVSVGDQLEVTKDQTRVEGFLALDQNMQYQALQANAQAYAQVMADMVGAFDDVSSNTTTEASVDEIPDELLQEAVGE